MNKTAAALGDVSVKNLNNVLATVVAFAIRTSSGDKQWVPHRRRVTGQTNRRVRCRVHSGGYASHTKAASLGGADVGPPGLYAQRLPYKAESTVRATAAFTMA